MKKYLNNKEERLDIHFKDKFENFEETPNQNVWENIEAGIDIEGFDKIFNNKLSSNEHTPAPEVWENVQEGIPLNLFVKRHLENLMKTAAILLCFMSVTLYFSIDKNQAKQSVASVDESQLSRDMVATTSKPVIELAESTVAEKDDFVYEIKKKKRKKRNRKAKKEQDVDVDELWKLLMEDDEFADVMDEDTKLKILTPPVQLPLIEETIAAVDNSEPNNIEKLSSEIPADLLVDELLVNETVEPDLKIWVPLVVVEKHEIEKLIHIYDEAQASKKTNKLSNQ